MRSILKAERESSLKFEVAHGEPSPDVGKDGWIEQILRMAITGVKHSEIKHAFKNITFINFNYDRCTEQYLFWSLHRLGLSTEDASETIETLNVIRPYGTLGSILPRTPTFLKSGAAPPADPFDSITRIRTFTENDSLHDQKTLSKVLLDASLIIFLGFGFHPQNLKLLTLPPDQQLRRVKVLATVFEVHPANHHELITNCYRVALCCRWWSRQYTP